MNLDFSLIKQTRFKNHQRNRNWILLIPFVIITLLLVIVPLIMIFVKSFIKANGADSVGDNWMFINGFVWEKILISFIIALITTFICMIIAYPFAYFLSTSRSKVFRTIIIFVATAPVWTSFLVKLVGLKTFFDICAGFDNSTYGHIWTMIGFIYLYLPFMIMPLYSVLSDMPKNLVYASYDLGYGPARTFFKVTLPYTKVALISGITLVFLPSLTTVAVPQFLNNNNDNSLIGDIIVSWGESGLTNDIEMASASALSLVLSLLMLGAYGAYILFYKVVWKRIKLKRGAKNE
ncbi:MAG: ABC transporter permease [Mycoplasmataceae bacterium]|nr:ABC transporter permease [Mycoplasmataceae bacterium]